MTLDAAPGDVLAVAGGNGFFDKLIRLGARLQRKPDTAGHVVIVTHRDDKTGHWLGVQGQPGGVGPCDVTDYLTDQRTRSNHDQPRPNDGLAVFLVAANKAAGTPYDWSAIVEDGCDALGDPDLGDLVDTIWRWPANGMPDHVVCSSLAAALYRVVGWAHPCHGAERICAPCDWWAWSDTRAWEAS